MIDVIATVSDAASWAATITTIASVVLGTLGALVCGRAGVLPFSAEGLLVLGTAVAVSAVHVGMNLWIGVAFAITAGLVIGCVHGMLVAPLALSQRLTGIAITLFAIGCANVLYALVPANAPARAAALVDLPWLSAIPLIGRAVTTVFRLPPVVYLAVGLTVGIGYVLVFTPLGLALRTCGEAPAVIAEHGQSVNSLRVAATLLGSALMAIAGATVALTAPAIVSAGLINGRGFIWLALAAAARWRVVRAFGLAVSFGLLDGVVLHLQPMLPGAKGWLSALPFLLAFVVFAMMSGDAMRRFAAAR